MELDEIVGGSEGMQAAQRTISKVAATDATVLITGESGTGKELMARAIHNLSRRKERRFVPVDCGALCPPILESELFGHVRGAFTGASADKPGLVEAAEKGTLFLDEIGNLDPSPQQKLLRFLECGEYRSLGGVPVRRSDVRVVTATNRDLRQDVQEGRFRKDLFYRLNHVHIHLPPLRERQEDIPLLVEHFLKKTCDVLGRPRRDLEPEALETMTRYPWPGNIRELAHVIQHLVLMAEGPCLRRGDLPEDLRETGPNGVQATSGGNKYSAARRQVIDAFNASYVAEALRRNAGNVSLAARQSGLTRQNLQALMKRYRIRSKDYRASAALSPA